MDSDLRDDPVRQLLNDFVRDVSLEVLTPVFSDEHVASSHRSPTRRRTVAVVLSVAVGIAAVAVVLAYGPRNSSNQHLVPTTRPIPLGQGISLPSNSGQPEALLATGGLVWVGTAVPDQRTGRLYEFEEPTGRLVATIRLPSGAPFQIAGGHGAIWLRTQQGESSTDLVRVDPRTHRVTADIPLHSDGGLAVTKTAVWTVDGSRGLVAVDPQTATVAFTVPLPGGLYPPLIVEAGALGVFVGSPYDGTIWRVNDKTHTVSTLTSVGKKVDYIVEVGDSLWVSTSSSLVQVAVTGGLSTRTVQLDTPILGTAYDGLALWVTTDQGPFEIDPASGTVIPSSVSSEASGTVELSSDPVTGETWAAALVPQPSLVQLGLAADNRVIVPNLVGITVGAAARDLQAVGLYNSVDDLDCSGSISGGKVVAQIPAAQSQVARGTRVSMQVSCR